MSEVRATQVVLQASLTYTTSTALRATQVVLQVAETYTAATNIRATQVVLQTAETYATVTNVLATQVVMQVARTVAIQGFAAAVVFAGAGSMSVNTIMRQQAAARFIGDGRLSFLAVNPAETTWPSALPQCPNLEEWEEVAQSNALEFKPEVGPSKMRRKMTQKHWIASAGFRMNNSQLIIFKSFYETTMQDGTLSFSWAHPITKVVYDWNFMPDQRPKITRFAPNASRVQIKLIRR